MGLLGFQSACSLRAAGEDAHMLKVMSSCLNYKEEAPIRIHFIGAKYLRFYTDE